MCFIVWGSRGITTTPDRGSFQCPSCMLVGVSRSDYKKKCVKKYGTLYFIPLIPMETLGEYIECSNCLTTFKVEVLELGKSTSEKRRY